MDAADVSIELVSVDHAIAENRADSIAREENISAELPDNKQHHLIFCYSSTVAPEVRLIVNEVEARGLKCCFHERDFITGKTIMKNIEDLMKSAQGVVFILTEDFTNSHFFQIEAEHALELQKNKTLHHVIPVRLDTCKIPMQLKYITCVDLSNRSHDEAALEIYDTFVKLDKVHKKRTETVGGELAYQALLAKWPRFSTDRFILVFEDKFRNDLQTHHIEIPESVLEKARTLVNKSLAVEHYTVIGFIRVSQCVFFVASVILLSAVLFCITPAAMNWKTAYKGVFWPVICFSIYVVTLLILICIDVRCKFTEKLSSLAVQNIDSVLWRRVNRSLLRDHHTIVFYHQCVFIAMRLNIKPCKEAFKRKIRGRPTFYNFDEQLETEEVFTNRMFDGWLSQNYKVLTKSNPMKASVHVMANRAPCPCTYVQEYARTN